MPRIQAQTSEASFPGGSVSWNIYRPDGSTVQPWYSWWGGNTFIEGGAEPRLTFPNARYVVQRGEYVYATHTNERTAGSYFPHNFAPIVAQDRFDFVDGEREIEFYPRHRVEIRLNSEGPRVVDIPGAMRAAAVTGVFRG